MKNYLEPYLIRSADLNYETPLKNCTSNHVNSDSCLWYHSMWQYLRLFNLVSTPSWHHRFYINNLFNEKNHTLKVLISGLADYSMLAYVDMSAKRHNCQCDITAIDLCKTPLLSAEWYAEQVGRKISTLQTDIFNLTGNFDIICADAFLTRFKREKFGEILQKWYSLLNAGGRFVTTIRVHNDLLQESGEYFENAVKKFKNRAKRRAKLYPNLILSPKELADKAEIYANKMVSNVLGNKEEILVAITKQGFKIVHLEDVNMPGELFPTRYLRIVAEK